MKVFLSSTAEDLTEYRKVADDTILRLAQESLVMERFGPRPGTPIEECERLACESDIVICIVAHRYGSIPAGGSSSFTQREVETAHKAGKKVLAWIVADDYKWTEKKEQDLFVDPTVFGNPTRESEVTERIRKLVEFKAWLRNSVIHESFTTPDDLGRKVAIALQRYIPKHSIPQRKVSIARLPTSDSNLFGREAELKILDDAWANPQINIVSFIAWGGVGKTALVNHWLKQHMARHNYRGADYVYGWSFFSQGTREQGTSADLFIDQALRWFGDEDPSAGGPWDKGQRLAQHLRQSRTLLILDGLEPLQYPPGLQEGRLKDAAMQALLVELAAQQPGLCVISTREPIADLVEFENSTVIQPDLDDLSPQAGARLLRAFNVRGDDEELELAAEELDGHALSLTLLGSYLQEVLEGDIRRRQEIADLFDDLRYGSAAERMISAYEKWLGEGMELAILRLLGLFDRPADIDSLVALREAPPIAGLTESLQRFKGREWNQAVSKLRRIKLLADAAPEEPGTLDAHPLIRDYFKRQLKTQRPSAWRKANQRLYAYLKNTAPEFPGTIEEMSPLFAAIGHGCAAGLYQDALGDIYVDRIQRGSQYFNKRELGAMATELITLSNFFEEPWQRPVEQLRVMEKAFVLHEAGTDLKSQGRLHEAAQAMQAALDIAVANDRLRNAATAASNLAELFLTVGNLEKALALAQQGVDFAGTSGDEEKISSQTTLGHIWHALGRVENAIIAFNESELLQQQFQPNLPMIYSVSGFQYCELLLEQGEFEEVKKRAHHSFAALRHDPDLLSNGLDNLLLGRAELQAAQSPEPAAIASMVTHFQTAVDRLRKATHVSYLCIGLIARAELHRFTHAFQSAERDLSEVLRLVTRSGMDLYLADYHLESARLRLAQNNKHKGREHLTTARNMINRMGYHRRDKEVAELEAQLG